VTIAAFPSRSPIRHRLLRRSGVVPDADPGIRLPDSPRGWKPLEECQVV
jgi:hypothetical protein